ncbi:metal-dependent hydrolase [Anaeromyxobacter oryzisoli]|uniref:metal-dependent hydrolase n=1 Tax=Anaeromyxobacter oryzisoli TaxID=2925408 RepID=UPI001F58A0C9|nr:metal-dependent hydrolase [Anaeromyxobacter sp. SG63]
MRSHARPLFALFASLVAVPLLAAAQAGSPAEAEAPRRPGPAAPARGRTELTWYGHSAFVLKTPGGTVIAIDPWFSNPKAPAPGVAEKLGKVDYVLVTHGHFDHVGDAVAIGKRTGAKLVTTGELAQALVEAGYPKDAAGVETVGNVGGTFHAGDATVIMVPAIHSSTFTDDKGQHPAGAPVGFVIQVKGGPTIYHTGDTDVTLDMKLVPERYGRVDVMLACIGGHFTMDPKGAALAASYVKPRTIVPMHFGTFPALTGTPRELEAALKGAVKVHVMEPGKTEGL